MNSRRRWRWVLAGAAAILIAIVGMVVYARLTPRPVAARGDPAVLVVTALTALERSDTYRLSEAQVSTILPLLRVLRDTDPADVEASRALAQEIMRGLSAEQRAEVERLREEALRRQQERRAGQGGFGPPRDAPGGAGPRSRAAIRQRLLGRLIERLETRE